jgi:serine/threonine-protein kinase
VVRQIGEGSFSLTYAAQQRPGRLPVALKEFFPQGCWRENYRITTGPPWNADSFSQSLAAFWQEGVVLERFHHQGIVRVLAMFRANGTAYLVEELLEGRTLGEEVSLHGPLSEDRVVEAARQVGEALIEIHAAGLVHSDLKPDNLYLTDPERYVILDFGTAHSYLSPDRSRGGEAAVTPGYSPLEQYQKDHCLTPAADVYALAATAYHLLQGFPAPDSRDRSRGQALIPLTGASEMTERALTDALQLHPLRRTPGIGPFLESLGLEAAPHTNWVERFGGMAERSAHLGATTALVLHADSETLFSGGHDGRYCAWSWPHMQARHSQQAHPRSPIRALAVSKSGRYLVSGAQDGSVKLWSAQERSDPYWLVAAGPAVHGLQFHPVEGYVVAAFADGTCRLLDPNRSEAPWQAHQGAVCGLDIHPQGHLLATGGQDQKIILWDLAGPGSLVGTISVSGPVHSVRFNPEGTGLLACTGSSHVGLWDVESLREVRTLFGHRAEVWDARFTCQPNTLVTVSGDHYLYAFRADSGRMTICSQVNEGMTGALAVDPQQRLLATGGSTGQVKVWRF